jgi:hypothetical protein
MNMAKVYMMLQVLCDLVLVLHVSAHTCLIANAYIALAITSGVIALANAIPDRGALTKLDISSPYIVAAQGEDLQRICAAGGIELAK